MQKTVFDIKGDKSYFYNGSTLGQTIRLKYTQFQLVRDKKTKQLLNSSNNECMITE